MATANLLWGAPRIHGEILKLGIDVAERTVSRLMPKRRPEPSQTYGHVQPERHEAAVDGLDRYLSA